MTDECENVAERPTNDEKTKHHRKKKLSETIKLPHHKIDRKIENDLQPGSYPKVIFSYGPRDQHPVVSSIVTFCFLFFWVGSVFSPWLLFYTLWEQKWHSFFVLLVSVLIPYVPGYGVNKYVRSFYKLLRKYFKYSSLILESPIKEKEMLCVHPHGIFCMGWGILCLTDITKSFKFCVTDMLKWLPWFLLSTRMSVNYGSVEKEQLSSYMKKGINVALLPGGFEDATIFSYKKERLWLKYRKGFIKMALRHGYSLRPVYCFGESQTYWNIQWF